MLLKGVLGRVEAELILNQFAAKEAWRARLQNTGRPSASLDRPRSSHPSGEHGFPK